MELEEIFIGKYIGNAIAGCGCGGTGVPAEPPPVEFLYLSTEDGAPITTEDGDYITPE